MVTEKQAERGTVIVMNPKNGEILAYAVYPTFDPNNYKSNPSTVKELDTHRRISSGVYIQNHYYRKCYGFG